MCVAVAPARFSQTVVYAGEARRNGDLIHVAGYQNVAQGVRVPVLRRGLLDRLLGRRPPLQTGNAMILHFPAVPGSMSQDNVLDTTDCPRILEDMVRALKPPERHTVASAPGAAAPADVQVFDSGIYTVVLAEDASAIPDAIELVPERKRPPLNPELFDWYRATFPGWPVALCCFDNRERTEATPMLWWYPPRFPDWLCAPAVDAHDGRPPSLTARVRVDHWVVAGSTEMEPAHGTAVAYRDRLPSDVAALLPGHVVGGYHHGLLPNGDFVLPVAAVRSGSAEPERRLLAA